MPYFPPMRGRTRSGSLETFATPCNTHPLKPIVRHVRRETALDKIQNTPNFEFGLPAGGGAIKLTAVI